MADQGQVGPQTSSDGAVINLRLSRDACVVTQDGHSRYAESAYRGNMYIAANQTGVTTQAGLSATTPVLTLFNPKGNNKVAAVVYAGVVLSVANAAAAIVWLAANINIAANAVTGTAATFSNCYLGNAGSPTCSPLTAATLPAAPIAIAQLGVGLTGAITTVPGQVAFARQFDGALIVGPGAAISFQTSTASGASSTFAEIIWEEFNV